MPFVIHPKWGQIKQFYYSLFDKANNSLSLAFSETLFSSAAHKVKKMPHGL